MNAEISVLKCHMERLDCHNQKMIDITSVLFPTFSKELYTLHALHVASNFD